MQTKDQKRVEELKIKNYSGKYFDKHPSEKKLSTSITPVMLQPAKHSIFCKTKTL